MKQEKQGPEEFLKQFGSEEALVEYLQGKSIKGKPKKAFCCPIANLLTKEFPDLKDFAVGQSYIYYTEGTRRFGFFYPQIILDFVDNFDEGRYPDLYEKSTV